MSAPTSTRCRRRTAVGAVWRRDHLIAIPPVGEHGFFAIATFAPTATPVLRVLRLSVVACAHGATYGFAGPSGASAYGGARIRLAASLAMAASAACSATSNLQP